MKKYSKIPAAVIALLIISAILMTGCSPPKKNSDNSAPPAGKKTTDSQKPEKNKASGIFEPYDLNKRRNAKEPLPGQTSRSFKIYSPDKKWYAYLDVTTLEGYVDNDGMKFFPKVSKLILVKADDGEKTEIIKTRPGKFLDEQSFLQVVDWTKDSKYLMFSRYYFEGESYFYQYNAESKKLTELLGTSELGKFGLGEIGWFENLMIMSKMPDSDNSRFAWDTEKAEINEVTDKVKSEEISKWETHRDLNKGFPRNALVDSADEYSIIGESVKKPTPLSMDVFKNE